MEKEICVLGDTNGNLTMFEQSLRRLRLIDDRRSWIGGSARLVLMGDVRADRFPWGIAITDLVAELNHQATSEGGTVVRLAGNHDSDEATILLSSGFVARENLGFSEILKHLPNPPALPEQMFDPQASWSPTETKMVLDLINSHLKNPEQRAALLRLYREKQWDLSLATAPLIHTEDWSGQKILFTHVPPTEEILAATVLHPEPCPDAPDWISHVNALWKTRVLAAFRTPSEESFEDLESLAHHYLAADITKVDWEASRGEDLARAGVGFAVHGHINPLARRQTIGPVKVFAVGSTSGIYPDDPMEAQDGLSVMIFGKNKQIYFGETAVRLHRLHSA